jgi:small subunit ribosomal protein S18
MQQRNNNYNNSGRSNSLYPMQLGGNMMQGGKNNQNQNQNKQVAKKKVNPLGKEVKTIDYLDAKSLLRYTNDQGKILPKRITGVNAYQQRQLTKAIKYARHLALLPFVAQDFN